MNKVEAYESLSDDELAGIQYEFKSVYLCQVFALAFQKQTFCILVFHITSVSFALVDVSVLCKFFPVLCMLFRVDSLMFEC